ncbi:GntR family transcriptional regulator [Amycolatopsis sp. GM8]|uniref:GntR family transcriptional regulator n=1 Tax=Amycolatopsis sp. GM8 TaxID=2896530 RepID=UPI001F1B1DCA|nr:GntR family transcriptional regulator [Amycolatopsis sp. GM8]
MLLFGVVAEKGGVRFMSEAGGLAPLTERPENLTNIVFAAIRDRIVDSSLPPGSSVSEAMLSKQLQVSKTPVREALLRLRHIGLVESTSRGLRVVQPSIAGIRDAFEFRAGIEAMAGRYAADRATTEQHDRIVKMAADSLTAARDGRRGDFLSHDQDFHLAVARAARNEVLFQAVENSIVLTRALRWRDVHVDRDFVPDAHEHVAIADLIRAGSPDLASAKLAEHIHRIMLILLDVYPGEADQ